MEYAAYQGSDARRHYPPIHKARLARDVARHKEFSRFVIVFDQSGQATLIDNGFRQSEGLEMISLIAVIGPVHYWGEAIPEAVLLEIGYRRTRPYRPVQSGIFSRERFPVGELTAEQVQVVYPIIQDCLQAILIETRAKWKNKGRWFASYGANVIEKGIQITVHRRDRWLYTQLLREHAAYFERIFLRKYAKWIRDLLKTSKYNRYAPKQYGPKARKVGESLRNSRYFKEPLLLETLLRMVGRRTLVESILMDLYGHLVHEEDPERDAVYFDDHHPALPQKPHLWIYKTLDQPKDNGHKAHAKGCIRFEVILETGWIQGIEGERDCNYPFPQREEEDFIEKEGRDYGDDCPF